MSVWVYVFEKECKDYNTYWGKLTPKLSSVSTVLQSVVSFGGLAEDCDMHASMQPTASILRMQCKLRLG